MPTHEEQYNNAKQVITTAKAKLTERVEMIGIVGPANGVGIFVSIDDVDRFSEGIGSLGLFINVNQIQDLGNEGESLLGIRNASAAVFFALDGSSVEVRSQWIKGKIDLKEGDNVVDAFTSYVCEIFTEILTRLNSVDFKPANKFVITSQDQKSTRRLSKEEINDAVSVVLKNKHGVEMVDHRVEAVSSNFNALEYMFNSNLKFACLIEDVTVQATYTSMLVLLDSALIGWDFVRSNWERLLIENEKSDLVNQLDVHVEDAYVAVHRALADNPKADRLALRINDELEFEVIVDGTHERKTNDPLDTFPSDKMHF